MELSELMQSISNNNIPHFMIFFGEEQKIIDQYVEQIHKTLSCKYILCNSVIDVLNITRRKSLDKSNRLFVVIDDYDFAKNEATWKNIDIFTKSNDYVILRYNSIKKTDGFYKNNKQFFIQFSHLSNNVLQIYISRILNDLSEKNISKLIDYCGSDYGRILMECDKIKQYSEYINVEDLDICFDNLDKQGLFHQEIGDITFELTDAVLAGYPDVAIKKLDDAKRKGEQAITIISILYNGFRNLLAYQGLGKDKTNAMERTGMTKGELWGCNKNKGGYSLQELKRNMLLCQQTEYNLKSGNIDETMALDYIVLHCLQ